MQYDKIVHLRMKMLQNTTLTFPWAPFVKTEAQIYDFHLQILHISADWSPHQKVTLEIHFIYKTFSTHQQKLHPFLFFSENITMVQSVNY